MQKSTVAIIGCLILLFAVALQQRDSDVESNRVVGIDFQRLDQNSQLTRQIAAQASIPTAATSPSAGEAELDAELNMLMQGESLDAIQTDQPKTTASKTESAPAPVAAIPVVSNSSSVAVTPAAPQETAPSSFATLQDGSGASTLRNPFFQNGAAAPKPVSSQPLTTAPVVQQTVSATPAVQASKPVAEWASTREPAPNTRPRTPVKPIAPDFSARAARHVEQGNILARRGATATANGEFIQALVAIADGRDNAVGNNSHNQSLKSALQVLDEVRDLHVDSTAGGTVADPAFIVGTHICGVVSAEEAVTLTRTDILNRYLSSISRHLVDACGNDPIAGAAMASLGKLHAIKLHESGISMECEWNIAMTLFRTALICNPQDARSSNEMGVLYAKVGDHQNAKDMLQSSLRIRRTSATWRNLAWLHNQLGEHELAGLAEQEAGLVASEESAKGMGLVQWIDPQSFGARPEEFDPASNVGASSQTADARSQENGSKGLFSNPLKR